MPLYPDSLPTLGALPGLPNWAGTPLEEEEDLSLTDLFWPTPDLKDELDVVPPSVSAPEPRRSKYVLSIARYYATLTDIDPRKAHK
jgi:hypothetical protein